MSFAPASFSRFALPRRAAAMLLAWGAALVALIAFVHPIAGLGFAVASALIHNVAYKRLLPSHWVTLYTLCLLLFSSRYVLKPIGALGYPAALLGFVAAGWWLISRAVPRLASAPGRQPVRGVVLAYLCVGVLGFGVAFARPIESVEAGGTGRVLLAMVWQAGIALLVADGLRNHTELRVVLVRLVNAGTVFAAYGMIEYLNGKNWSDVLKLPGFQQNSVYQEGAQFGVRRVLGAALHPIEFGVVLTMLFPIALHFALFDPVRPSRRTWPWARVAVIGVAIPMSVSRSAVLGLFAVAIVLLPTWPKGWRGAALRYGPFALVATRFVFPGLLGTIISQFTNLFGDPSVTGRTQDYGVTNALIAKSPLWGRGIGTFLPEKYFFLDNQYLGTLIEQGIIGLAALVAVLLVGMTVARGARHRSFDHETRHLGQVLAAAIAVQIPAMLTFDALSYPTNTGLLFLLIGAAGAMWRFEALDTTAQWVWPYPARIALRPRVALNRKAVPAA